MKTSINKEFIPQRFRPSLLPDQLPAAGEAVLCIGDISVFKEVSLSEEEARRAGDIHADAARRLFLAGRRLVRGVLSRWLDLPAQNVPIELGPGGKPALRGEGMPCFSIAHSGDLVAVLFSKEDAGVDLELERAVDAPSLARRFFSTEEADAVSAAFASSGTPEDFFRLWTCREAAIKGDGRGLGSLLSRTRVAAPGGESLCVQIEDIPWTAFPWRLVGGYHGAVAFREAPGLILWCDLR